MSKLIIEGARRLKGEINIQGSKNSILPILAASLVAGDECVIHNCPRISDVDITLKILEHLGSKVNFEKNTVIVNSENIIKNNIPNLLMRKMRSSIIFLGALISAVGSAEISLPGGCELGPRPIDMHIEGLRQLGLRVDEGYGALRCSNEGGLEGCNITLSFPSVGATENLIIASVKAHGTTVISNIAKEPEIMDLVAFLNSCGAKIECRGEGTLVIEGVQKLHGAEYTIIPDRIAAVTYMSAAAVTVGDLLLKNVIKEHIGAVIPVFEEAGCTVQTNSKNSLRITAPTRPYFNRMIRTMPYPGFPTDAQAPVMAMSCLADGTSVFVENIFTNRYKHVGELLRLGADIKVEGRVAIVEGVKRLFGAEVTAMDLRGAAALVVAGLGAEGITKISGLSHIDRGYENLENNLGLVGASIKRV
ncbi:MAG: UDP-N-acetylglucosamine 1-carboxyvinyltransferase [Clostridia bacterium]|nr:UDP-N-acetylglucosamine 1-carboxyvinyltransferase [Clostridia bacterium]